MCIRDREQARLEQRAPWPDLQRLARDLDLSPIADMADVMRLDDQGAALADVLTSRVKELRDAHLNRERTRAHQDSERMTIWMTIPVIVFALVYLPPPLLTIAGVGRPGRWSATRTVPPQPQGDTMIQSTRRALNSLVGTLAIWQVQTARRDDRGLSQSTENAVLLTGAVTIALSVIALVGGYVARRLGELA